MFLWLFPKILNFHFCEFRKKKFNELVKAAKHIKLIATIHYSVIQFYQCAKHLHGWCPTGTLLVKTLL